MEKYENLGLIGEGSYGMVWKCKNKENGQMVAVKKFLESEEDRQVKKIAMREIKMLKHLHHENLVNLIEVFRRKKRLYLVFEYVEQTLLHEMEKFSRGMPLATVRRYLWQITTALQFCHSQNVIHRDLKPENVLVSKIGVIKLCDFGFARTLAGPGEIYTDYVATRWYRSPELLVGDPNYGTPVDVWALGCLFFEMLTADPLFPGDSDLDQLHHIMKCFGPLPKPQVEIFHKNALYQGVRLPEPRERVTLAMRLRGASIPHVIEFLESSMILDPSSRLTAQQLLDHNFFTHDAFHQMFPEELAAKLKKTDVVSVEKKRSANSMPPTTGASPKKMSPVTRSPVHEDETAAAQQQEEYRHAEAQKKLLMAQASFAMAPPLSPGSAHRAVPPQGTGLPGQKQKDPLSLPSLVPSSSMKKNQINMSSLPVLKSESLPDHNFNKSRKNDADS